MESINSIFQRNMFVEKPTNYKSQQKTMLSVFGNDFLSKTGDAKNDDITAYIDILYGSDDVTTTVDKLKMSNGYSPMKSQKLHYNNFLF